MNSKMLRWNVWRHSAIIYYFIMYYLSNIWKNFENESCGDSFANSMEINNSHCIYNMWNMRTCMVVRYYLKRQQNEIQFEENERKLWTEFWILNAVFSLKTRWWVHFIYSHCSHRGHRYPLNLHTPHFHLFTIHFLYFIKKKKIVLDVQVAFASSEWIMMIKRNQK